MPHTSQSANHQQQQEHGSAAQVALNSASLFANNPESDSQNPNERGKRSSTGLLWVDTMLPSAYSPIMSKLSSPATSADLKIVASPNSAPTCQFSPLEIEAVNKSTKTTNRDSAAAAASDRVNNNMSKFPTNNGSDGAITSSENLMPQSLLTAFSSMRTSDLAENHALNTTSELSASLFFNNHNVKSNLNSPSSIIAVLPRLPLNSEFEASKSPASLPKITSTPPQNYASAIFTPQATSVVVVAASPKLPQFSKLVPLAAASPVQNNATMVMSDDETNRITLRTRTPHHPRVSELKPLRPLTVNFNQSVGSYATPDYSMHHAPSSAVPSSPSSPQFNFSTFSLLRSNSVPPQRQAQVSSNIDTDNTNIKNNSYNSNIDSNASSIYAAALANEFQSYQNMVAISLRTSNRSIPTFEQYMQFVQLQDMQDLQMSAASTPVLMPMSVPEPSYYCGTPLPCEDPKSAGSYGHGLFSIPTTPIRDFYDGPSSSLGLQSGTMTMQQGPPTPPYTPTISHRVVGSPTKLKIEPVSTTAAPKSLAPGSPLALKRQTIGLPASPTGSVSSERRFKSIPRHENSDLIYHAVAGSRSAVLEQVLNGQRDKKITLAEIKGHLADFSCDQFGSRQVQHLLDSSTGLDKEDLFRELVPSIQALAVDAFGNYVVQKMLELGSLRQRDAIASKIVGSVLELSMHVYGCRVVQRAMGVISPAMQIKLSSELNGHILECVRDQNANHVVQKAIEQVQSPHVMFVIEALQGHFLDLAKHPYGCRVIQQIFEHTPRKDALLVFDELHKNSAELISDRYGNYVVQHVLENGSPEDRSLILQSLQGQLLVLSRHKFASNVVEKCLVHCNSQQRSSMVTEILESDGAALLAMMKDQYANYVVQKMLDIFDDDQRTLIVNCIKPHLTVLRKYPYGKHLIAKIEKLI